MNFVEVSPFDAIYIFMLLDILVIMNLEYRQNVAQDICYLIRFKRSRESLPDASNGAVTQVPQT